MKANKKQWQKSVVKNENTYKTTDKKPYGVLLKKQ